MSLTNDIKSATVKNMSGVNHIEKSKDTSSLLKMVEGSKKYGKSDVISALEEACNIEGDIDEISLNPFSSPKGRIKSITKKFISLILKEIPKLRVKQLPEILTLLNNVKSELESKISSFKPERFNDQVDMLDNAKKTLEEMTGASSGGSFVGTLFSTPLKRGSVVKSPMTNKKKYNVSEELEEEKGFSNQLSTEENPEGETEGLTPETLNRILMKIAKRENDVFEGSDGDVKKIDTTEATMSGSSGSYETPSFWAKNDKNHRGASKPQFEGGKFVKIKDKCKKFPYCDQGDIKSLELYENGKYNTMADKVAKDMGEDPIKVKSIVLNDLEESLFRERIKQVNQQRIEDSENNNIKTDK